MTSEAHGKIVVLAWSDDGVIKPVVLDTGSLPVTESNPLTALDVTLAASDITLPVAEQSPLSELDVTLKASDITVPTAEQSPITSLYAKQWGYWGGAWRNQPIIWGFTDVYIVQQEDISDINGAFYIDMVGPPSGQVWHIKGISVYRSVVTTSYARIQVATGVPSISIEDIPIGVAGYFYTNNRELILKNGYFVRVGYVASQISEVCITAAYGYKMQIS